MQGAAINPAKIQSVLRQATDEQLVMMLRRPDKIPSMFIQQEISRRQAMRQAAQAEQAKFQQQTAPQQTMPSMDMQKDLRMNQGIVGMKHGGQHPTPQEIFNKQSAIDRTLGVARAFMPYGELKGQTPYEARKTITAKDMELLQGKSDKELYEDYYNFLEDKKAGIQNLETPMTSLAIKPIGFTGRTTSAGAQIPFDITDYIKRDPSVAKDDLDPEDLGQESQAYIKGTPEYEARLYKGPPPDIDLRRVEPKKSDGKEAIDNYLKSIVGKQDNATAIKTPDYTGMNTTLNNLEKAFIQNNKDASDSLSKSETGLRTLQSNTDKMFETQIGNIDEFQKRKLKLLLDTKDLDALKKQSEENYQSAINYLETDTKIADAQKKLLDAMKPQATPAQRFFGYLAQVGADIAASDRETFLEAGGEALSKAMQDYKFDNEKERERFVNNAKLMLEFENLNQQNQMRIFDLKGNLYNMKANNVKDEYEKQMNILNTEEGYSTAKFGLTKDRLNAFENFEQLLGENYRERLNLNKSHVKDMFSIVEGRSAIEQQQFSNALQLASNDLDRMQVMAQFLTPQAKNFRILQSLPEDQKADFLKLFAKNTKDGITPDVTARTLATDLVSKIDKLMEESTDTSFTRQDAMKQVMGDDLYGAVVADDGSLDYLKLYQYMFGGVYNIQAGGGIGNIGGGQQPMSFQQYKQGTN